MFLLPQFFHFLVHMIIYMIINHTIDPSTSSRWFHGSFKACESHKKTYISIFTEWIFQEQVNSWISVCRSHCIDKCSNSKSDVFHNLNDFKKVVPLLPQCHSYSIWVAFTFWLNFFFMTWTFLWGKLLIQSRQRSR